jgi:rod shape-determining protein MreD
MTRFRVVAAIAAILTALVLQAVLIGPWTQPVAVSLPAVLVAAVALHDGPAAGMAFGFTAGLAADLGASHPAGILAATWTCLGVVAGLGAAPRSVRGDAAMAAVLSLLATAVASTLLTMVHADGATLATTVRDVVPAGLVDALLALLVVPVVRRFLRSEVLRAPHPVYREIVLAGRRG